MINIPRQSFTFQAQPELAEQARNFERVLGIKIEIVDSSPFKAIVARLPESEAVKLSCSACNSGLSPFQPEHRQLYDLISDQMVRWMFPRFQCREEHDECPLRREHAERGLNSTINKPTHVVAPDFLAPYERWTADFINDLLKIRWQRHLLSLPEAADPGFRQGPLAVMRSLQNKYEALREGLWDYLLAMLTERKLIRRLISRCAQHVLFCIQRADVNAQSRTVHFNSIINNGISRVKLPDLSGIFVLLSKLFRGFATWPGWRGPAELMKIDSDDRKLDLIGKIGVNHDKKNRQQSQCGI